MSVMAEAGMQPYQQQLTVDPKDMGRVRRVLTAYVGDRGWSEVIDPAVSCATEMLTNVLRHADSNDCVLLVQVSPSGVRVVVSDDSPELPVVREPNWCAETGRGMAMISGTADAWGADPTSQGKDVWVEFRAARGAA